MHVAIVVAGTDHVLAEVLVRREAADRVLEVIAPDELKRLGL